MKKEFTMLSFALKNLKRKPVRSGILIIAICLLVSVLVFALSLIRWVDSGIRITSERLGADLLIVPTGSRGAAEDVLLENKVKTFYMDKEIIQKVKEIDGIAEVSSQTYLASITGACCDVPETVVVAFDQDTDFILRPWLDNAINRKLQKGEAIVGHESAFNIRVGLTDVDAVLFGNMFKMIGILEKTGTGLDTAIFIDDSNIGDILKTGKADLRPGQTSVVFAKVKKGFDPYIVSGKIEDSIIEVDVMARKDIGKNLIGALKDINNIFAVTVILVSILSAFLAWAVFSAIANERSREVGIMRAIGARESHIVKLFLLEVFVIGSIGSFLGIISGTTASLLLGKGFMMLKNLSTDLSAVERASIGLISFIFGAGICIAGALSPVRKVKKMEPLVVIKGE